MPIDYNVAQAAAVFVEVLVYGVYTCLFAMAMSVMSKRKSRSHVTTSYWVFLLATISMFIISTIHCVLGMYRFTRAYVLLIDPLGPLFYINDIRRWDFRANNVLLCLMTYLGDALVIYRCYYVWSRNFWVVAVPALLLAFTVAVNAFILYWWDHPFIVNSPIKMIPWLDTIYPLAFTQNVLTTGLIAFKIWSQHLESAATGVVDRSSRLSLMRILRIIIESAMIYTLQLLVLIVLYFRGDNFQIVFQSCIPPSIGIVFVLIAVRVHVSSTRSTQFNTNVATIPPWLDRDESPIEMHHSAASFGESGGKIDDGPPTSSTYGPDKRRPIIIDEENH